MIWEYLNQGIQKFPDIQILRQRQNSKTILVENVVTNNIPGRDNTAQIEPEQAKKDEEDLNL